MKDVLREKSEKIYIFYLICSLTGFRASDILPLRVRDVRGKRVLGITEKKTHQYREVPIPTELKKELERYVKDKKDYVPLFPSPMKRKKKKNERDPVHLDYSTVYKTMHAIGKQLGMDNVGTHTGRKTYGYRIFEKTGRISDAQIMLGHKDPEHTRCYIGADEEYKLNLTKQVFG